MNPYYPIHHYTGQAVPSLSDPLSGVKPDEAFTAGVILASRATLGMVLGGAILYVLNPSLGIPRWLLTTLGATAGLALGTYAGIQGAIAAMPSLGTTPSPTDFLNLMNPLASSSSSASVASPIPSSPQSSSPSQVDV